MFYTLHVYEVDRKTEDCELREGGRTVPRKYDFQQKPNKTLCLLNTYYCEIPGSQGGEYEGNCLLG
jgi:hypothetical protein